MKHQQVGRSLSPVRPGDLALPQPVRDALSSVVIWLVLGLASGPPGAAQDGARGLLGETIEVRVVNLEVVVEDRHGNRVPGLAAEDFRLEVDGKVVPVDYFSEVADAQTIEDGKGIPGLAPRGPVGISYLAFIDDYFTVAPHRNRVLKGIRDELSRLGREDRMAVVAFDGKRIDMLSSWSQSPAELQRIFDDATRRPARGLVTRAFLRHSRAAGPIVPDVARDLEEKNVARDLEEKVENISLAVTATLRSFANPPGRKVMLLLAGGWPYSPAGYVASSEFVVDRRGERLVAAIHQTANLLGYTLYPIDVAGIEDTVDIVSSNARPRITGAREEQSELTLRVLAQETGGEAFLDSARLTAFDRTIEDTRSYYWLGFTPVWRGDDRGHRIRLSVLRPGLRLRYRKSYRDFSRSQEVSFMVESALLFGELPGAQPLHVEIGKPVRSKRKRMLPLKLTFPLDRITVLPHRGRYAVHLELRIVALDEGGHRSDVDLLPITLNGTRRPVPGEQGVQEVSVRMRRRKHQLVVSVHDPLSGTILATVIDVDP